MLQLNYMTLLATTPVLIFILHVAAARIFIRLPGQAVVIICSLVGFVPMAAAAWAVYFHHTTATRQELIWAGMYGFIVYAALAYSYFHVFNMSETARRIRILYEIYTAKQLKASEIASLYNAHDMLHSRLERLLSMKQVKLSDDKYLLDRRSLYYAARIIAWWGNILGLPFSQTIYDKLKRAHAL
ncbi:MAG: hypothetical protein A3G39_11035 [Deltaproteobacteria bacterium RIFCSPLOWO2_12_FULL_43_16]|nr:MAG: hypothetical protein A2Z89_09130 [Deltaproteobacteria bacterium GWA2_43_19]OGQ13136.1 MAG: hypothetical protein A3D30_10015 [Deltaproteobacteria bacterium RIFCSPHIGHO2_02_FULL_43_33]OGQ57409.1 MAG: hypothetical protein A3G39_11035 [Deltaproteobacteria bacterium RIFCSPLOWO2_12_FULL_43_16]HBR16948.1 hypothetical protein [Deltaproteobacteria bacterium]